MISQNSHDSGKESASGNSRGGKQDEKHGIVNGHAGAAIALDARPERSRCDACEKEQNEEHGKRLEKREKEADSSCGKRCVNQKFLESFLADQNATAHTPDDHASGKARGPDSRRPCRCRILDLDETGAPEREAEFAASGKEHRCKKEPETRDADNVPEISADFGPFLDLSTLGIRVLSARKQKQESRKQTEDAAGAYDIAPAHSVCKKCACDKYDRHHADRPEGMSEVDVPSRFLIMQILDERRREPLDDPFPESGNHQGGKHDAVDRRKCGEQDAESHAEHCETERPALAPASRKESAQDQCRHHGHGAPDLQDSA